MAAGMSIAGLQTRSTRVQFDTTTKKRRLQPAEAPILPCCRVNAAFLSAAFGRDGGGAKLRPLGPRYFSAA
jgi:hypothetical protein